MRRMSWLGAFVIAAALFLIIPARAGHAQPPPPASSCMQTGIGPPFYTCTLYESAKDATGAEAPSELSDVLPIPPSMTAPPVPAAIEVAIVENGNLTQTDPHNWSDVVQFLPPTANSPFGSVQMLSNGCATVPDNETDISCFPAATQFAQEVGMTGNDFQDCTFFLANFQGAPYAQVQACSGAPINEPAPNIPEAPLAAMLPIAAVGVVGAVGFGRRLRRT
jgi:hypothetical protein